MQVVVSYAVRYDLMPEYVIPSTVPSSPPLWPGQRRGKRVDLADLAALQAWEVEPYSASGSYPEGHGPSQIGNYLDLLNAGSASKWMLGRYLAPINFTSGPYDVNAWWEEPGLIVFQAQLNAQRVTVTVAALCLAGLAQLLEAQQKLGRPIGPGDLGPLPAPSPLYPPVLEPVPIVPVPIVPVPVVP